MRGSSTYAGTLIKQTPHAAREAGQPSRKIQGDASIAAGVAPVMSNPYSATQTYTCRRMRLRSKIYRESRPKIVAVAVQDGASTAAVDFCARHDIPPLSFEPPCHPSCPMLFSARPRCARYIKKPQATLSPLDGSVTGASMNLRVYYAYTTSACTFTHSSAPCTDCSRYSPLRDARSVIRFVSSESDDSCTTSDRQG
ncbi:hypothetical protein PENSPDRAFT_63796 [Peniophora sp. CONT]|nr:hypothetical protein PENSPDRAFT_63796 [Peniophora sp. CONT]